MTVYVAKCAKCAKTWTTKTKPFTLTWCSRQCADAWMETRPTELRRQARVSLDNCVDSITAKIVYPNHRIWSRSKPPWGLN